jgi:predicted DNA-binding transcriptional regulator YafY
VQYVERAEIIGQRFEPRPEMRDLAHGLDSEAGTARILYNGHTAELELERPTSIEPAAEGGAVATVPYGSVRWLLSKVLSHRAEAEVLAPDWLREAVRDQAESLLTTAEPEPAHR